jgi:hypothetical protein
MKDKLSWDKLKNLLNCPLFVGNNRRQHLYLLNSHIFLLVVYLTKHSSISIMCIHDFTLHLLATAGPGASTYLTLIFFHSTSDK